MLLIYAVTMMYNSSVLTISGFMSAIYTSRFRCYPPSSKRLSEEQLS